MYENYLSEDHLQITLPVPLGSIIYQAVTGCCDICCHADERTQELRELGVDIRCLFGADCHTRAHPPKAFVLELSNLDYVFRGWGTSYFATKEQALEVILGNTERARKKLMGQGVQLREDGYFVD